MKGQISNLKLDPGQTKAMMDFAVREPKLNAESIMNSGFITLGLNQHNQELVALPLIQ